MKLVADQIPDNSSIDDYRAAIKQICIEAGALLQAVEFKMLDGSEFTAKTVGEYRQLEKTGKATIAVHLLGLGSTQRPKPSSRRKR